MTGPMTGPMSGKMTGERRKTAAAARLLAYKLVRRAEAGLSFDLETALRLVDRRLAPASGARRRAASEGCRLSASILAERGPGGRLAGELRFDLRVVASRGSGRRPEVVTAPLRVHHADGTVTVVAAAPAGTEEREADRLRAGRRAAEAVFGRLPGGRPVSALLAGPDGPLREVPPQPPFPERGGRRPAADSLAPRAARGRVEAEDVLGPTERDPGAGARSRRP